MEFSGKQRVPSSRQTVWDALINPAILARCIPGCTALSETEPDHYSAEIELKVGPISARFRGKVSLEDKQEPESCRIVGSGSGGAAGFAKGSAQVRLDESDGATWVVYDIDIETGGKIASLGARMMRRVIDANIESFFECLAVEVGGESTTESPGKARPGTVPKVAHANDQTGAGMPMLRVLDRLAWFGAGVGVTLAVLLTLGTI